MSVEAEFAAMVDAVRHVGVAHLDTAQQLRLYALFKYATIGPCNTAKPSLLDWAGRAKWSAWNDLGDKQSKAEAQAAYVRFVREVTEPAALAAALAAPAAAATGSGGSGGSGGGAGDIDFDDDDDDAIAAAGSRRVGARGGSGGGGGVAAALRHAATGGLGSVFSQPLSADNAKADSEENVEASESDESDDVAQQCRDLVGDADLPALQALLAPLSPAERAAAVNATERTGAHCSALHLACDGGHVETVRWLIDECGADHSIADGDGLTALHYAALGGWKHVAELLLARGANRLARDDDGVPCDTYLNDM